MVFEKNGIPLTKNENSITPEVIIIATLWPFGWVAVTAVLLTTPLLSCADMVLAHPW